MAIAWRSAMSIGDESVDNDHKALIELINIFERSIDTFKTKANILIALDQLSKYAETHFLTEEALQLAIGYPDIEKHKIEHQKLLDTLQMIKDEIEKYDENQVDYDSFIELLRFWLLDHIFQQDLLLKPYFEKDCR